MHKLYSLILYVDNDKLAQDANAMLEKQDNKSECIRTMLADLVKANGVIEYYTDIPRKERLERFFGYSGKTENTSETGKRKGGRKCTCQFILSPYNDYPDGLESRKSIFHNFANIRSIKQAIKHDFRNSTFGTRVFFMFFNQVNRQFS